MKISTLAIIAILVCTVFAETEKEEASWVDTWKFPAVCTTVGGIVGSFVPTCIYRALGLSRSGPTGDGFFSQCQGGGLRAGSCMACLQSTAMLAPLLPVLIGAGAVGTAGYYLCDWIAEDDDETAVL